ncbi:ABC transporter substrate-binding protein [Kitasatospora sp. NPDC059327]|uniref:ABC transporter substrate-binding protein n=1 Tax=Kitasatospora sp. NPDC059327 TaxID=3346803 RepID=UPI00369BBDE0
MTRVRRRVHALAVCCCLAVVGVAACGGSEQPPPVRPAVAVSARNAGGMAALVAAARSEGKLNVTTLLPHWANYGGLIDGFTAKYGIQVVADNPYGSSQDEIDEIHRYQGQERAPDVLDLGDAYAQSAADQGLLATYEPATFDRIPDQQKDADGRWANSYGGYVSIGCDAKRVRTCPASFADLLKPEYKGMVALNGDPTTAGSAFAGVFAAALANGGSFDDISPGVAFFAKLDAVGNYNRANPNPAAIARGETPISIEWDFLNLTHVAELAGSGVDWRVAIPFDGSFSQYYAQAINKTAPHPAAARLWEEYLASAEGQNLRLVDYARPVLLDAMAKNGTLDKALAAKLPTVEGTPAFPTEGQLNTALQYVRQNWAAAVPVR